MRAPHWHQSRSIVTHPHAVERLVFEPNHEPIPRSEDGGIDVGQVTAIVIVDVTDCH